MRGSPVVIAVFLVLQVTIAAGTAGAGQSTEPPTEESTSDRERNVS